MIDRMIFRTKRNNASFLMHLLSKFLKKSLYFYFSRRKPSTFIFKIYIFSITISLDPECLLLYLYGI